MYLRKLSLEKGKFYAQSAMELVPSPGLLRLFSVFSSHPFHVLQVQHQFECAVEEDSNKSTQPVELPVWDGNEYCH